MKRKNFILFLFVMFFLNNMNSQNIVEQLNQFSKNADLDCYISKIQENVNEYFILENKFWGRDKFGVSPKKIELKKEELIPILTIQFVNTDNFNFNDNIYNHMQIDSTIVFTLARVDKNMNVVSFINFFDGVNGYFEIESCCKGLNNRLKRNLRHILRNIKNQEPDLILYSHSLSGFHNYDGFMFIKNGLINVYRVNEKDSYELNDFLRMKFSLDRIRNLNNIFVPLIYQDGKSTRRAGFTPENEKIICP